MSALKFTKGTDEEHKVELDSYFISAAWSSGGAFTGQRARFEVRTAFVGNGAPIRIVGRSEQGEKLGKISDVIRNNKYVGEFEMPEDIELDDRIYFEVELPKNGLSGESNSIPVFPTPKLKNMKWSATEARRGDVVTLSAEVRNVRDETEVKLVIYEYDQDGAHDRITELPGTVKGGKISVDWEYEYHEDTDEIPTDEELKKYGRSYNPPEYFFTIKIGDLELGKEQESGLLKFKDWIELELKDESGNPIINEDYVLHLPDGQETLDGGGFAKEEDVPPGKVDIEFPNLKDFDFST